MTDPTSENPTTPAEALEPCPFCSSTDIVKATDSEGDWWWLQCNFCQACGPLMTVSTDRVSGWNLRTVAQAQEALIRELVVALKKAYITGFVALPRAAVDDILARAKEAGFP